ncbi:hypothetical protein BpHYR1_028513 [Brachionus plicatilis]|uniref:Uncharacterized protein n=1 Tax=Brachionus plicatilis TaxID=10195 RepID=A0A3M7PNC8_BRAPC|nr:hypothetical protein BpHYR1_028513 [Brachionus plicatilis]
MILLHLEQKNPHFPPVTTTTSSSISSASNIDSSGMLISVTIFYFFIPVDIKGGVMNLDVMFLIKNIQTFSNL